VVKESITFGLPDFGDCVTLHTGDRFDLPAGVTHNAVVGANGVACLEAHRWSTTTLLKKGKYYG
jgi:hypothetical protein